LWQRTASGLPRGFRGSTTRRNLSIDVTKTAEPSQLKLKLFIIEVGLVEQMGRGEPLLRSNTETLWESLTAAVCSAEGCSASEVTARPVAAELTSSMVPLAKLFVAIVPSFVAVTMFVLLWGEN